MAKKEISMEDLLKDLSTDQDKFLKNTRIFCKLPIILYFQILKRFNATAGKELIFYPERRDAYNKKPHRAFIFTHPELGELMCYLLHRTVDWFDVVIAFTEYDKNKELTVNAPLLFSMSFWTLDGTSHEKINGAYFDFNSGSQGSVQEGKMENYFRTLKKHYEFRLEILKFLEGK